YLLLASLSLHATKGADNIAAIWPPSGYFLALLLLMAPRARLAAFGGMIVASSAANLLSGVPMVSSVAFTAANTVEGAVALWLVNSREKGLLSFMVPRAVVSFCISTIVASFVSAG